MFLNEEERNIFMDSLSDFVSRYELVDLVSFEIREADLFSIATTKEKRNAMLEKFFKTIFKEVGACCSSEFEIYCPWNIVCLCFDSVVSVALVYLTRLLQL